MGGFDRLDRLRNLRDASSLKQPTATLRHSHPARIALRDASLLKFRGVEAVGKPNVLDWP
jgi:hypothetical protein